MKEIQLTKGKVTLLKTALVLWGHKGRGYMGLQRDNLQILINSNMYISLKWLRKSYKIVI